MMGEIFVEYREERNQMMMERIGISFIGNEGNRILGEQQQQQTWLVDWRGVGAAPMIAGGLWGCQEKWRQSEAHGRAGGPPPVSLSLHPRGPRPRRGPQPAGSRGPRPAVLFLRFRLRVRVRRLGREGEPIDEPARCQPSSWNGMHWPCLYCHEGEHNWI